MNKVIERRLHFQMLQDFAQIGGHFFSGRGLWVNYVVLISVGMMGSKYRGM